MNINDELTEFDFSQVENLKFRCKSGCGSCCFYQLPMVTSTEINNILTLLKKIPKKRYKYFIDNWLASQGRLLDTPDRDREAMIDGLKLFWWPAVTSPSSKGQIVQMYSIYSMPSSGRCRFLDPIDFTCFIYQARPYSCRLYPFNVRESEGKNQLYFAMSDCEGLGVGDVFDKDEFIKNYSLNYEAVKKDIFAFHQYVEENDLEPNREANEEYQKLSRHERAVQNEKELINNYFGRQKRPSQPKEKLIQPLMELGMIPAHPFFEKWNEQFESLPD